MGLMDAILGNAKEVEPATIQKEYGQLLAPGEKVERAYKLARDSFFLTDRRLVHIDRQGITGRKVSYLSIPYRSITGFMVETAGDFDMDAELKIWVSGRATPLEFQFNKHVNIYGAQAVLALYVAK
jgi:hypothetical protein